jgi:hypothetical protein
MQVAAQDDNVADDLVGGVNIPIKVVHIPVHLVLHSGCSHLVALLRGLSADCVE